ncbi:MAG: hypothetical protein ACRDKW_16860, partial [Actinomycetota bacterium]
FWDVPSNWSPAGEPLAGDDVTISPGSAITVNYRSSFGSPPTLFLVVIETATLDHAEDALVTGILSVAGDGSYELGGAGSLTTSLNQQLGGGSGAGTFLQTGGTNDVGADLRLGISGGAGTYALSGGTLDVGDDLTLGDVVASTGSFVHSGGAASVTDQVVLGFGSSTSTGSYALSGTGSLSAASVLVGDTGSGGFTQTGGTNTITAGTGALQLGSSATGLGSYALSGGSLSAPLERIGRSGTGSFTQTGGTNTVSSQLLLGQLAGSTGTYTISGGQLSAGQILGGVAGGLAGAGRLKIDGGTVTSPTIRVDQIAVGSALASNGSHTMGAGNTVSAGSLLVGEAGTGTFTQAGGTNTATTLSLGDLSTGGGTYVLSGTGSLS